MAAFIKKRLKTVLLSIFLLPLVCGVILYFIPITRYLMKQGYYQIKIILSRRSMDDMMKDPKLDGKTRDRLKMVGEIRQFGVSMGLNNTESYKTVYDTGGKPVVWAVSACPKDQLSALRWKFPIVGSFPYLGFFDKDDALWERDKLKNRGYDTITRPVSAYSTLGILPDPLFSGMLFGSEEFLADTILHEMTHETVFVKEDIDFNESMANFVGAVGGLEFLKHRYGPQSKQVKNSIDYKHDDEIFSDFMADLYDELDKFYKSGISREEKISGREKIFDRYREKFEKELKPRMKTGAFDYFPKLRLNNAYILFNRRYHRDYNVFDQLYKLKNRDLKETISFLKSIKDSPDIKQKIHDEVKRLKEE